jgi:hypothetical protein
MQTIKSCPFCRRNISTAALKCKHCGSRIQELLLKTDPPIAAPHTPASPTRLINYLYYFFLIAGLAVAWEFSPARRGGISEVSLSRSSPQGQAARDSKQSQAEWFIYRTTAHELYHNYAAYEIATHQMSRAAAIEISGTILAIDRDIFDKPEIDMDVGDGPNSVALTLDKPSLNTTRSLTQGQFVKIRCDNMSHILGSPIGQGCEIIN